MDKSFCFKSYCKIFSLVFCLCVNVLFYSTLSYVHSLASPNVPLAHNIFLMLLLFLIFLVYQNGEGEKKELKEFVYILCRVDGISFCKAVSLLIHRYSKPLCIDQWCTLREVEVLLSLVPLLLPSVPELLGGFFVAETEQPTGKIDAKVHVQFMWQEQFLNALKLVLVLFFLLLVFLYQTSVYRIPLNDCIFLLIRK